MPNAADVKGTCARAVRINLTFECTLEGGGCIYSEDNMETVLLDHEVRVSMPFRYRWFVL